MERTSGASALERGAKGRPEGFAQRGVLALGKSDRLDSVGGWIQDKLKRPLATRAGQTVKDVLNGTWLEHPLHPALSDIPIGAWTATAVCDAITATGVRNLDGAANATLAIGTIGAVGAAIPGIADWSDTGGEQRRVGLAHAALNVAALAFQIGSLVGRRRGMRGAKMLSALGYGTVLTAAYLGGDLVFRQGVQVDRNAWRRGARGFSPAMAEADLRPETPTRVEVDGAPVMLIRHDGEIRALDDVCGHAGCALSQGHVANGEIVCPCHGSTYRLRDGAVIHGPSPYPQPSYDVRITQGQIELRLRTR